MAAATGSAEEVTEAGERVDPSGPTILDDHHASPLAPPPPTRPVPLLLTLALGPTTWTKSLHDDGIKGCSLD